MLNRAIKEISTASMMNAAKETVEINGSTDIAVAVDGILGNEEDMHHLAILRRLVNEWKGKKLSYGKALSGKGRLIGTEIDNIQRYYGLAIRNNCHDLSSMKKTVWATYFHKLSTDETPQHGLCPAGADS
ncbi:hypothetical protein ANN_19946 [Periplaneta americana]|uniref:Uncharacterized protein n=1 Tax=Periplaneta americana TaxID=6978 RepID=A0ABQ8SB98_PERAM|nr:hypothetical protein ANN_19946 [Periplaneta americana]